MSHNSPERPEELGTWQESFTSSLSPGAPPQGTPGGYIGEHIVYAYCTICRSEWVWNRQGLPPSMQHCGHDDRHIVIINYKAESHGRLDEVTSR